MDTYPRYTMVDAHGAVIAYRVKRRPSRLRALAALAEDGYPMFDPPLQTVEHTTPPRFRIKVATWPTDRPVVLYDTHRRGFRGQYRNLEDACRAMDNRIRLERGMPERIDWAHFRPVTPHVEAASA